MICHITTVSRWKTDADLRERFRQSLGVERAVQIPLPDRRRVVIMRRSGSESVRLLLAKPEIAESLPGPELVLFMLDRGLVPFLYPLKSLFCDDVIYVIGYEDFYPTLPHRTRINYGTHYDGLRDFVVCIGNRSEGFLIKPDAEQITKLAPNQWRLVWFHGTESYRDLPVLFYETENESVTFKLHSGIHLDRAFDKIGIKMLANSWIVNDLVIG